VAAVASLAALGATAGAVSASPPPWEPGPGGPDVIHVMHGQGARPGSGTTSSPLLAYRGGVVAQAPAVYLVFWGSQWTNNDPSGEAAKLQNFLGGLYGAQDTWSTSTTQFCQGVATGSTNCSSTPVTKKMITHPSASPLLDFWPDNGVLAPTHPKQSDLAAEAVKAAGHFGLSSGQAANAQFVIATAHNNNATGFGSSYCAWHSSVSATIGGLSVRLAYTNLPYIPDAGASCGANFVNKTGGSLDGVTIVEGHEYAETVTDPYPSSGWLDANGAENGDKCAWISSGKQGAAANITLTTGSFAVQSLWSNSFNSNAGGCVISY
jgi:serine protease